MRTTVFITIVTVLLLSIAVLAFWRTPITEYKPKNMDDNYFDLVKENDRWLISQFARPIQQTVKYIAQMVSRWRII